MGGSYGCISTMDFANRNPSAVPCSPLASGTHVLRSGRLVFLANYYAADNRAPDHRASAHVADHTAHAARAVGEQSGRALALAKQDQPIEIEPGFDIKADFRSVGRSAS